MNLDEHRIAGSGDLTHRSVALDELDDAASQAVAAGSESHSQRGGGFAFAVAGEDQDSRLFVHPTALPKYESNCPRMDVASCGAGVSPARAAGTAAPQVISAQPQS